MRIRVAGIFTRGGPACPELLVVRHEKEGGVYFLLPGGGVEPGESFAGCFAREMREELGVDAEMGDLAFVVESIDPAGSRHVVQLAFRGRILAGDPLAHRSLDPRVTGAVWLTPEVVKVSRLYPDMREELARLLEGGAVARVHLGVRWDE